MAILIEDNITISTKHRRFYYVRFSTLDRVHELIEINVNESKRLAARLLLIVLFQSSVGYPAAGFASSR